MSWYRRISLAIELVLGSSLLLALLMIGDVQLHYLHKLIVNPNNIPHEPVAIILGAGIQPDGSPSDALRDRLTVGESLYEHKQVDKLFITGDDGGYHADETIAMKNFLIMHGVPETDIIEDNHGYRTYESCKRAVQTYHITQAVVVTQRFHIGRALYLCNRLGIDTVGVTADLEPYRDIVYFVFRDIAASLEAWWDINVRPPAPPVEIKQMSSTTTVL